MPPVISENYTSRAFQLGEQGGRELVFDIGGTEDETVAQSLLIANTPPFYQGLRRRSISAEHLGGGVWKGYVRYEGLSATSEFSFDTSGGTTKLTQSRFTVAAYAPDDSGDDPPDFHGAIGVTDDGVEGCEVVTPVYSFSETHYHSFLTEAQLRAYSMVVMQLTGTVNAASFRGMAPGECLFMGASGSGDDLDEFPITYKFAGSPNLEDLEIGHDLNGDPIFTGVDKLGWDYLWVRYAEFEDSEAKVLAKRPTSVHVERVYYPGDFSLLGIGA